MSIQRATVPHNTNPVYYIQNHDALIEFLEWQRDCVDWDVSYFIRRAIPADRWDHYSGRCMASIHSIALMKMQMGVTAPIMAHGAAMREFAVTMFDAYDKLKEGEHLTINSNGGYCPAHASEITDIHDADMEVDQNVFLRKGNHLVLENDPELPQWTLDNFPDASYILNLRKLSDDALKRAMEEYVSELREGVEPHLVVYTTGMDREQMQTYTKIAGRATIKKLTWYKSTDSDNFDDMVLYAGCAGMEATAVSARDV